MATTIYADYDERIEEAKKEFSYDQKEDAYHEDNKEIISMYAEL
jgi:hypothetical protein